MVAPAPDPRAKRRRYSPARPTAEGVAVPVVPELQALLDTPGAARLDISEVDPPTMRALYAALRAADGEPVEVGPVADVAIPGPGGDVSARVYRPTADGIAP